MNKKQLVAMGVTGFALAASAATTYYWKAPVNGSWNTAANWCTDSARTTESTVVPGVDLEDAVAFPVGAYTVTSTGTDLKVDSITVTTATSSGNGVVLDIGGRTLTTTRTGAFVCLNGSGPATQRDFAKPYTSLEFRNGIYDLTTSYIQMIVTPPYYVIDDRRSCVIVGEGADVRTKMFEKFYNGSRVFVQDGGKLTCSSSFSLAHNLTYYPVATCYPFICVTGQTSQATFSSQVALGTPGAGFYVLDGATVTTGNLKVGCDVNSTNCFVRIDNSSLNVNGVFYLGHTADSSVGSALEIAGERARFDVRGGNGNGLTVYDKTGAHIDFEIPLDGFKNADGTAAVPLTAFKYTVTARGAGQPDLGATQLRITAKKWARRHPKESITLILLDNTNWNGVAALAANATVDIADATVVSKDGNKIILTAPTSRGIVIGVR